MITLTNTHSYRSQPDAIMILASIQCIWNCVLSCQVEATLGQYPVKSAINQQPTLKCDTYKSVVPVLQQASIPTKELYLLLIVIPL